MTTASLRVGFDYWPAATHAPGVGRYLRELVRALAALEQRPLLRLLDIGPEGEPLAESSLGLGGAGILRRRWRARRGWLRVSERVLGLRAETWLGKLDLFHRAHLLGAPSARAPQLIALAQPPHGAEALVREALGRMAAVLVFSEQARHELVRQFSMRAERIHLVPVGCDHWARNLGARPAARERKRLLVLGSVRKERGQVEILRAFERLRGQGLDADLVFCGRRGADAARLDSALRSSPVRLDVRWIDEPVENEMPVIVAGSSVLVHLSREEWTAVTPLEAMSLGVAVVASRLPCFVEALGELAEYVEAEVSAPIDVGLDTALERAFAKSTQPECIEQRRALAQRFTWEANARATLGLYEKLARSQA